MNELLKTYEAVVSDLTSQGKFYINLGLERVEQMLELSGNPQNKLKCIQVAGTNGKGSVCTMLATVLHEAGYKTGLYTSPHIFDYTERIKINGVDISKNDFVRYCDEVITLSSKHDIHLTEFEVLTVVMYKYFADSKVDIAVVETGLGGRFDATNVLKENLCSIITHIDLDHTDRLGTTKEEIAFEKSGIIKPNSFVITSEGYEVIKDRADELNTSLILTSPSFDDKYYKALSLKGVHQRENLALVLSALNILFPDIDDETVLSALGKVKNPCRFQYIKDKNILVDVAHNPDCFRTLSENLDIYFPNIKRNYVFGCLKTKDYNSMLSYITSDKNLKELYVCEFKNPNACSFDEISSCAGIECMRFNNLDEITNNDVLTVICGSFYMLNEILPKSILA